VAVPAGFKSGTKQVSVGQKQVCAINQNNKIKCWDKENRVKKVPADVYKSVVIDVSAGQHQNCAIINEGRLKCWSVDEN